MQLARHALERFFANVANDINFHSPVWAWGRSNTAQATIHPLGLLAGIILKWFSAELAWLCDCFHRYSLTQVVQNVNQEGL
jgi:hypothetical protein